MTRAPTPNPAPPDLAGAAPAHSVRHDLLQPAAIAMMMLEKVRDRNQDESLRIPLGMLEQALLNLASLINKLP